MGLYQHWDTTYIRTVLIFVQYHYSDITNIQSYSQIVSLFGQYIYTDSACILQYLYSVSMNIRPVATFGQYLYSDVTNIRTLPIHVFEHYQYLDSTYIRTVHIYGQYIYSDSTSIRTIPIGKLPLFGNTIFGHHQSLRNLIMLFIRAPSVRHFLTELCPILSFLR